MEIVIGEVLARNLRVAVGDELTVLGSGVDGSFAAAVVEVVGIFESGVPDIDRNIAEMPLGAFQEVFYMNGAGHQVVLFAERWLRHRYCRSRLRRMLPTGEDLVVHDWDALQPGLKQAIKADMSSAFFMYGILVILVAFSVLNTQLMSVLERTREFGIVMALGLRPGQTGSPGDARNRDDGICWIRARCIAGAIVTSWFTTNGLAIPGMDEMAAQFNLPSKMYPRVNLLTMFVGPAVVFVFTLLAAVYPALRLHKLHVVASDEGKLMRMFPVLCRLAWRYLWRNHRRTIIMVGAIAVGAGR